jgi:predicted nucleic acid-binding protein
MKPASRLLTLDANVLIASIRQNEPNSEKCAKILSKIPESFALTEPSIIYQEVCGTLARKIGLEEANIAKNHLDEIIPPKMLTVCDRNLCASAFSLCSEYKIYAIDALYLQVALINGATLVSLDKEDFIDKLKDRELPIETYAVSDFPY